MTRDDGLKIVLGPAVLEFVPDGDDPGVGTVYIEADGAQYVIVAAVGELAIQKVDAWTRDLWDDFVRGATQ